MMDRAKLLERIRALREKTVARGCTEAEAMAAAAKAAALMAEFDLDERDIEIDEKASILSSQTAAARAMLWATIGKCTNTAVQIVSDGRTKGLIFVGRAPGPDVACYLRDVCDRAVTREIALFKKGRFYRRRRSLTTKRAAVADFSDALVRRLCARLLDLFSASVSDAAARIALTHRDARFAGGTSVTFRQREERYAWACDEGYRAGNRVKLAHGVGGRDGGQVLIESRQR